MADVVSPAEVAAMLEEFGLPALWRTVRTDVSERPGEVKQQVEVAVACFAVKLPTEKDGQETRYLDAGGQPKGNSIFYVSPPEGVTSPSLKDLLVVSGRKYRLKSLDVLAPAGTLLLITATVFE